MAILDHILVLSFHDISPHKAVLRQKGTSLHIDRNVDGNDGIIAFIVLSGVSLRDKEHVTVFRHLESIVKSPGKCHLLQSNAGQEQTNGPCASSELAGIPRQCCMRLGIAYCERTKESQYFLWIVIIFCEVVHVGLRNAAGRFVSLLKILVPDSVLQVHEEVSYMSFGWSCAVSSWQGTVCEALRGPPSRVHAPNRTWTESRSSCRNSCPAPQRRPRSRHQRTHPRLAGLHDLATSIRTCLLSAV